LLALAAIVVVCAVYGCPKKPETAGTGASVPPAGPPKSAGAEGTLTLKGSDTMLQVGQALAEAFSQANPKAMISVTGGGSGVGIAAVIDGTCDIAQASRKMKDKEIQAAKAKGRDPKEFQVGSDGLAVIVNKQNPVSELTIDQLADIFTGKVKRWKDVGGGQGEIVLCSRDASSGTHQYFKEHVLNKGDSDGKAEFAASALLLQSTDQIRGQVAKNPNAIGYVGLGYVDDTVKVIKVAKSQGEPFVAPTIETVLSGEYPISRPLFFYAAEEPQGLAKAFIDWVLGPEGQKVVEEQGFVPLKAS
jgi:phosphate transport system substrate-binding protein